jgi:cytochrome b
MTPIRIWDLPTRIFHWALALAVIGLVITGNVGGNAMVWHFRLGYCVASLLIFRIVWGFVGGFWSRWKQFTLSPMRLKDHVFSKSSESNYLGHNPSGSLSVLVIVLFLIAQVGSGLISDDEIANAGPLTHLVSEKTIQWATYWHTEIGKAIILLLVLIHVLAIAWYFYRKKINLLGPMLTGDKATTENAPSSNDRPLDWLKALFVMGLSAYLIYRLVNLGP